MKISFFQAILMGIFGVAAIIGIFVFATHSGSNSGNTGSTTVGTVVIWGTLPKAGMVDALTAITQQEQSLKYVSYVEKNSATLTADLATAIATGNAPDLILSSQEQLLALKNLISPVPTATLPITTFRNTFIQGADLFMTQDRSGYYGLPFVVDPLALFSNRSILSSNGIAKPPVTWESLAGLVPSVAVLTPTKQITRGLIALGTYSNVHDARAILSTLFLQTGVPISAYSNGSLVANLTSATASQNGSPGQAVISFYTQFTDPSKVSYTWNASLPDSRQAFVNGDLALYLGYASEARFIAAANPNLDVVVTPTPQPGTAHTKNTYGLIYAFMIPHGAKNPGGAFQAAALLTNVAEQTIVAAVTGFAPATLTPLATAPADPVAAIAYAEALYTSGWLSPLPADTDTVFSSIITDVITGRSADSINALTSGERSLGALLQKK